MPNWKIGNQEAIKSREVSVILLLPDAFGALGFESFSIPMPGSWSDEYDSNDAPWTTDRSASEDSKPWKDSEQAREGKPLSESIADDVKLEARFEVKVPEKLAKKATKLLLDAIAKLPGATIKRLD